MSYKLTGALVLIKNEPGKGLDVFKSIGDIESVEEVQVITGDYDIMAILRCEDLYGSLGSIIREIRNIDGATDTKSHNFVSLRKIRREHL